MIRSEDIVRLRPKPKEIYPGISVDAEVVHGKPVISGTRIPVSLVLRQLAGGVTYDELRREYGLTTEQIQAALGYAAIIAGG